MDDAIIGEIYESGEPLPVCGDKSGLISAQRNSSRKVSLRFLKAV